MVSWPNPFFQENKNYKNKSKRKFPKSPRPQDPRLDPDIFFKTWRSISPVSLPVPERSWSSDWSQEEKGDPSWLCTSSQSHKSRRERELFSFHDPPLKEPLWNQRKKEKICWKCSRTFSFNDKVVLFVSIWENQDSLPENISKELENTSCYITSARSAFDVPTKPPPLFVTLPCYRAGRREKKNPDEK